MKGDFSRRTFDPRKHYSAVLQEQGRVLTDADLEAEHRIHNGDLVVRTSARLPKSGIVETEGRKIYRPRDA